MISLCVTANGGDAVDDGFCENVVKCCPLLARFTVRDVFRGRPNDTADPIRMLTDRGLVALSESTHLSDLQLRSVNVTGDGLYEFLSGLPLDLSGSRSFEISVAGRVANESTLCLLKAFRVLMRCIEMTGPANLRFASSDFVLKVRNATPATVDPAWSAQYMKKVEPLVDRVKARHPSLRVRLTLRDLREDRFDDPYHFVLYTSRSELKPPLGWEWGWDSNPHNSFANLSGRSRYHMERESFGSFG